MNFKSFHSRIRIVSAVILVFAVVLILKLFFIQVIKQNSFAEKADRQYITPVGQMFERGSIFFSKKDGTLIAAGTTVSGFKVFIKPKNIINIDEAYQKLSQIINLNYDDFYKKASKKSDPYEEISNHLNKETADKISLLKISGVYIEKDKWRFYPGEKMASHTLGFLAYKDDSLLGQYGLERFYNKTLSKEEDDVFINFFAEVFSNLQKTFSQEKTGDIITTIEPIVQQVLESELREVFNLYKADQIGGIIMNPQNGEIYGISAMPDFDLNEFSKVSDVKYFRHPFVEDVIEFGSVIKPLVLASAIDQGVITPETTYMDEGFVVVDKKVINNFDKKARGQATMQTVISQSLNTGMVFIENKMGHESFRNYMKSFGIGEKTGIDLPNETHGLIKNLESPRNIEYANASFGQGISLTPIEAVRAFSVIANGGNLIVPHLVKQIKYEDGTKKDVFYEPTKTGIIKKESAETATRMLVYSFDNSYANGKYKMKNYSIATKTGTAQVPREDGKGYYTDRNNHSFFGYFPAYDPQFIVFLFVKNPKGVEYAAQSLIPPFVNITKFLLNYYLVPPDR